MQKLNADRRKAIFKGVQSIGMLALGGIVWSAYIGNAKDSPLVLRPPGASSEDEFLSSCIKCGICVEVCPYYTLKLANFGDNVALGTPFFTPREIPCYMCKDVPCANKCPSGALDVSRLIGDDSKISIDNATMGVASIDTTNCIAYFGIQCDACYRACPLIGKAIYLEYKQNKLTNEHTNLLPMVDANVCTGCGMCERACITELPTIVVLPRDVALGKAGHTYIKTNDQRDENRVREAIEGATESDSSKEKKHALDYLNDGGLL